MELDGWMELDDGCINRCFIDPRGNLKGNVTNLPTVRSS